jgi:hypothetical protein
VQAGQLRARAETAIGQPRSSHSTRNLAEKIRPHPVLLSAIKIEIFALLPTGPRATFSYRNAKNVVFK